MNNWIPFLKKDMSKIILIISLLSSQGLSVFAQDTPIRKEIKEWCLENYETKKILQKEVFNLDSTVNVLLSRIVIKDSIISDLKKDSSVKNAIIANKTEESLIYKNELEKAQHTNKKLTWAVVGLLTLEAIRVLILIL